MCLYRIGENEVVTSHGASSDKIITVETINSRSRFRLNYVSFNTSFISAVRINSVVYEEATSYSPLYSAIKNEFIMLATRNVNNTVTISTLHNDGSDWNYSVDEVNAIAINSVVNSTQAKIYYSYAGSSSNYLTTGMTNSSSSLYSSRSFDIGSSNCANLIEVNDNIVAIS